MDHDTENSELPLESGLLPPAAGLPDADPRGAEEEGSLSRLVEKTPADRSGQSELERVSFLLQRVRSDITSLTSEIDELAVFRSGVNGALSAVEDRLADLAKVSGRELEKIRGLMQEVVETANQQESTVQQLSLSADESFAQLDRDLAELRLLVQKSGERAQTQADDLSSRLSLTEQAVSAGRRGQRLYDNVFYGFVILLLFLNTAMMLWWASRRY